MLLRREGNTNLVADVTLPGGQWAQVEVSQTARAPDAHD
jgi:hypothetical protein